MMIIILALPLDNQSDIVTPSKLSVGFIVWRKSTGLVMLHAIPGLSNFVSSCISVGFNKSHLHLFFALIISAKKHLHLVDVQTRRFIGFDIFNSFSTYK